MDTWGEDQLVNKMDHRKTDREGRKKDMHPPDRGQNLREHNGIQKFGMKSEQCPDI